ncbi:hypothetical protein [Foetidibacter luteolus]|uniref:hypothetical protein n=1 Tax=Foetidibacter luteolus TaxID=2608880 RepID=UPI00129B25A9|nr:hypothetical protein [Foetidibacter luteolus]
MKRIIISACIVLASSALFAQADTSKIEQYCQVIATPRLLSNRVTIDIDFGEQKSFWRDERLRSYDGRLKKFNTVIDALNFMGKDGWVFINAYPVINGSAQVYHFGFKKLFNRSEVQ